MEDKVHVADAVAEAGCKIVSEVLSLETGKCVSIAVDNAAEGMAQKLRTMLCERFDKDEAISASTIIVPRDLAHSIDLGPKDFAREEGFIKPVLHKPIALTKLMCTDRIGGIKKIVAGIGR